MRIIFYAFLVLFFCPVLLSKGQVSSPTVSLRDTTRLVLIGRNVSILEDKTARLTLAQVRQRTDFVPSYSEKFQYGYTSSAYWFRFEVTNHSQENQKHWLLGLLDAISLDYVDLYLVYPNGQIIHQRGGDKTTVCGPGIFCYRPLFSGYFPHQSARNGFFSYRK